MERGDKLRVALAQCAGITELNDGTWFQAVRYVSLGSRRINGHSIRQSIKYNMNRNE